MKDAPSFDDASMRRQPKQQRAMETKKKLLAAAHEILISQGAQALTTRRVAELSGLSIGTIYVYFPTKEALLFWVFESRLNEKLKHFDAIFDTAEPTTPGKQHVENYFEWMRTHKMWSKLDLELRNAEELVPGLKEHTQAFENALTRRYVEQWKLLGATWDDDELSQLASYAHGLDHLNMKLQQGKTREERQKIGSITSDLFHELTRMTGATYDEPLENSKNSAD